MPLPSALDADTALFIAGLVLYSLALVFTVMAALMHVCRDGGTRKLKVPPFLAQLPSPLFLPSLRSPTSHRV